VRSQLWSTWFFLAAILPVPLLLPFLSSRFRTSTFRKAWLAIVVLSVLANPLLQRVYLEGLDSSRGQAFQARALSLGLVGSSSERALAAFGKPSYTWPLSSGSTIWGYKQVPGYWLGSHFQVSVRDGIITSIEPNDD
jgi:hypothetical protein